MTPGNISGDTLYGKIRIDKILDANVALIGSVIQEIDDRQQVEHAAIYAAIESTQAGEHSVILQEAKDYADSILAGASSGTLDAGTF